MFQKYYSTNLISNFIKNLVGSTYIPNIPVWRPDTQIIKGSYYLTQNYILKAINNYTPTTYGEGPRTDLDANYFDIVDKYVFNTSNHGYCTKYISPNSYYDPKTHYYLGQYLRMQRDMYDLNLMAYYNCWCGEYSDKLRIKSGKLITNNTISDGLKTLLIPIKYNQKYTLYINTNTPISLGAVCISNSEVLNTSLITNSYKYIGASNFFKPYVYEGVKKTETTNSSNELEKYLTLLIQLPTQSSINIVVLEGDYSSNNLISYGTFGDGTSGVTNKLTKLFYGSITNNDLNYFDYPQLIDEYCKVSPELIRDISDNSYAFDDRLVEYLLLNPITNINHINKNIERVQDYFTSNLNTVNNKITTYSTQGNLIIPKTSVYSLSKDNYKKYLKDTWDNQLRMYIYDVVTQHWKTPKTTDISGYVDKDVETIIGDNT